jgi:predicted AlkP superfamily pyrophosphatase or phosphodiesterase
VKQATPPDPAGALEALALPPGPDGRSARKALVICIDGVRFDSLTAASTPVLDELSAEGFLAPTRIFGADIAPTLSGPAISSIATGVWPDKHGVPGNQMHGHALDRYPDFLTRLESGVPPLRTFAALDWAPLGLAVDGGPVFSDAIEAKITLATEQTWAAYVRDDARLLDAAVRVLRDRNPDATFVYLGATDVAAHDFGCLGAQYRQAIETADRQVGELLAAVRERPAREREDWLVIVVTDHGHLDQGGHGWGSEVERTAWLLLAGRGVPRTAPAGVSNVDIAPTVLAHLGVAWDGEGPDGHALVAAGAQPPRRPRGDP